MIVDCEQGGSEWLQMRCGAVTASRMSDVLAKRKDKTEAAPRANYRKELVIERLTGLTADHFVTKWMEEGTYNEPLARAAYELATDSDVQPVGYCMHDSIKWFGGSPDSLVGADGLLEIKCPKSENHLDILLAGVVPDEYKPQMLAEMACSGRQWVDFVSFDPRMPKHLQLFVRRFNRDEKAIEAMESEVKTFLAEVEYMMAVLQSGDLDAILRRSVDLATSGPSKG